MYIFRIAEAFWLLDVVNSRLPDFILEDTMVVEGKGARIVSFLCLLLIS